MIDRKNKNTSLPYAELIIKILTYTGYNFREEGPEFMHTKIGQVAVRKMGYFIKEFIPLPPRRARKRITNDILPSSLKHPQ